MSYLFIHPRIAQTDISLSCEARQEFEIEEPLLTFRVELKNECLVFFNSDRSLPPLIMPSTLSTASFLTNMSAFSTSHHGVLHMLSWMGINEQAITEYLNYVISSYSQQMVGEVIHMGVNVMEIGIHIKLLWTGFYDVLMAINDGRAEDHGSRSSAEMETSLETCKVNSWDARENCGICLDELGDGETQEVSVLPCSHPFHERCVKRWLEESESCPLCRLHI